jgi:hypothetical protein
VYRHPPGPAAYLAILYILLLIAASGIQGDFVDFSAVGTAYRRPSLGGAVSQRKFFIQIIITKHHGSTSRRPSAPLVVPAAVTLLLLAARLAAAPALSDPVEGSAPDSLYLGTPLLYLAFAPFFTLWDGLSMLSMSRLEGFLTGVLMLYLVWRSAHAWLRRRTGSPLVSWTRELAILAISIGLFLGFIIIGAVWHRPMLSLEGVGRDQRVVDFHSHTNVSHDVRDTWMRGFDAEANRRWHARAGFDAVFITDHNTVAGLGTGDLEPGSEDQRTHPVLCPGIEVSAWRAHIVLLGDTLPVERHRYNGSLEQLLTLLRSSDSAYGALSVASLPEYQRNHWSRLDQLTAAGLDGFEIVNAAPKANELGQAQRDSVIALARLQNRFVVGVSDSHGWGSTNMVWNLVPVRYEGSAGGPCEAVLGQLRTGFPAVQVIERHRLRPDTWWPMWLTPIGVVWETWRSMGWALTISWLVWLWGVSIWRWRRHRPDSAGPS